MKRIFVMLIAVSLLAACAVVPAGRGHRAEGVIIAPMLPSVVVLETEPYFIYKGFHYHYDNGRWFYSRSKNGPWADLPRDHYPKEVRFKKKDGKRDHDRDYDHRDDDRRHGD